VNEHIAVWRQRSAALLKALKAGCHPKEVIAALAEDLLGHYLGKPLIDPYDSYQSSFLVTVLKEERTMPVRGEQKIVQALICRMRGRPVGPMCCAKSPKLRSQLCGPPSHADAWQQVLRIQA
jgi:hypothetical protein